MKELVVTRGAGYIGSHECKALAAAAWSRVRLTTSRDTAGKPLGGESGARSEVARDRRRRINAGLGAAALLDNISRTGGFIHFAAFAMSARSVENSQSLFIKNNVWRRASLLRDITHVEADAPRSVFFDLRDLTAFPFRVPITRGKPFFPTGPINPL